MRLRATAFGVLAMLVAGGLEAAATDSRWRATATPPRAALPTVEIVFGYPGPYIPMYSAPIELHATALVRFSGHIGFRYAVGRDRTWDVPVFARVHLAPGQRWTFRTWSSVRQIEWWRAAAIPMNRELVVEWRDTHMRLLASRSVGLPPWSRVRPLAIGASAPATRLGSDAIVAAPFELSPHAQWYRGFSAVVVPLAAWIDLPAAQKNAALGSHVRLVFTGFTREGQQVSAIDRALLPVEFVEGPGTYRVPWPYPGMGEARTAPFSWRLRRRAVGIGDAELPPVVVGEASSWAASDALVGPPLAEVQVTPLVHTSVGRRVWTPSVVLVEYRPPLVGSLLLLLSIGSWFFLRQRPRQAVLLAAIACAFVALGARDQLLRSGPARLEEVRELGEGIVARRVQFIDSGAAPLAARPVEARLAATAAFDAVPQLHGYEIRDSSTPPGFGEMSAAGSAPGGAQPVGWDSIVRMTYRREPGRSVSIRVVSAGEGRLVFDYEAPEQVEFAAATWFAKGRRYYGEATLDEPRRGRATIRNTSIRPGVGFSQLRYVESGVPVYEWALLQDAIRINLFRRDGGGWKQFAWTDSHRAPSLRHEPFSMRTDMLPGADGKLLATFLVPAGAVDPASKGRVSMYGSIGLRGLTIATTAQAATIANEFGERPIRPSMFASGTGRFTIPPGMVQSLERGGVVTLTAEPAKPLTEDSTAEVILVFDERKS